MRSICLPDCPGTIMTFFQELLWTKPQAQAQHTQKYPRIFFFISADVKAATSPSCLPLRLSDMTILLLWHVRATPNGWPQISMRVLERLWNPNPNPLIEKHHQQQHEHERTYRKFCDFDFTPERPRIDAQWSRHNRAARPRPVMSYFCDIMSARENKQTAMVPPAIHKTNTDSHGTVDSKVLQYERFIDEVLKKDLQ